MKSKKVREVFSDITLLLLSCTVILSFLFHHMFQNPFYYFAADISELYFPWWVHLNQSLRSGQFPILNSYWFAGSHPFAAIESSVFYPPFLFAQMLFRVSKSIDIAYLLYLGMELGHYLFASTAFYLLTRFGLKLNRFSSILGGIIYGTSGAFIGRFVHPVIIFPLAWLPLIYLFLIRFFKYRKPIDAFLGAVTLTVIIVSGHPQIAYYIVLFMLAAGAYFVAISPSRTRWFILVGSIAILTVGAALASYKILMTLELGKQLVRVAPESMMRTLYDSLHPAYYLTLVVPYLFGRHQIGYWGSDYPWGNWEHFLYIGLLPLFFVPFSWRWNNRRLLWFFYGNLGLVIFLLLGKYSRLSSAVVQRIPFGDSLAFVSRFADLFHFFLVVIVTIGVHVALKASTRAQQVTTAIFTALVLGIVLFLIKPEYATMLGFRDRTPPSPEAIRFITANITQSRVLWILSSVAVLALFLSRRSAFRYALIGMFSLDLFLFANDFNPIEASPGPPSQYFGENQITQTIKRDEDIFRVNNLWPRNFNMITGIESVFGYRTTETKPYRLAMSFFSFDNRNLLNLMNVKYFISDENLSTFPQIVPVIPTLWENTSVLPRTFFVPSSRTFQNDQEMIRELVSPSFKPRQEVLLYGDNAPSRSGNDGSISEMVSSASVEITRYRPTKLIAKVSAGKSGFLVFSQFQYPGWNATIDEVPVKLLPANVFFYSLPIPEGNHVVQFYYQSKPLVYGLLIAGLTASLLIVSFLIPQFRRYWFVQLGGSDGKTD